MRNHLRIGYDAERVGLLSALKLAKTYIAAQRYEAARSRLLSLISSNPNTPAATEARSLPKQIEEK